MYDHDGRVVTAGEPYKCVRKVNTHTIASSSIGGATGCEPGGSGFKKSQGVELHRRDGGVTAEDVATIPLVSCDQHVGYLLPKIDARRVIASS